MIKAGARVAPEKTDPSDRSAPAHNRKIARKAMMNHHTKCAILGFNNHARPVCQRLYSRIQRTSNGCWEWQGAKQNTGYGRMLIPHSGHVDGTHRISWMIHNGPIPEGMRVLHHCDNPSCVNPDHLFLGTQLDNMRDCINKGRQVYPLWRVGEANLSHKLTEDQARAIRIRGRLGETGTALAREFGVSKQVAYKIIRGDCWKHV